MMVETKFDNMLTEPNPLNWDKYLNDIFIDYSGVFY